MLKKASNFKGKINVKAERVKYSMDSYQNTNNVQIRDFVRRKRREMPTAAE